MHSKRINQKRWLPAVGRLVCILIVFCGLPTFVFASVGQNPIPLQRSEAGYFTARVSVNDAPAIDAIIDTAATAAMIHQSVADEAGIGTPVATAGLVPVFGLLGEREFPLIEIGHVSVGTVRLNKLAAAYNDREQMPGAPLVIPAAAFGSDVLDFDFPSARFSAYDGRPEGDHGNSGRGNLIVENGLFFTEVRVNGVRGRALIDTGSPFTFINSEMAKASGAKPEDELTQQLIGATGGRLEVSISSVKRLSVAKFSVSKLNMIVVDPPLFEDLGLAGEPAMLIGLDLLSMFRVQIDIRRRYIILTPESSRRNVGINLNARDTRIPQ
ncbi:retropepsin-like domain-containing protein [Hyphomonas sp. WL0036]|uniref:retropepsin-like aspartic protease n=1 Tax=Hyphomonas sediminis TaxID=2866160 RepID=UPI001C7E500A|nr:retropepsin-like aspartic protease [Hyphomonas sediminis]MBY9066296.1 retropepsin-like domain-containing protein [Hyphomonas sediminis]